jgi:EAL domain-containing protein (putative c-di-GMP-specific phosphodiesterase class I)
VHGALAPEILVSIAEERGLIEPIGNLVLQSACHLLQATSLPWVALNLSPVQLRNEGFVKDVLEMLKRFGIEPRRLQFEVQEATLMADNVTTVRNLNDLRAAGARVALDDFGTGYSSLNHLRTYPVDKVKIDRSLVNQLPHSTECQAITRAIVSLAKSLNKVVAAEGVATPEEQDLAVAMGCDELQGFGLSKPLSLIHFRSQFGDRFDDESDRAASR